MLSAQVCCFIMRFFVAMQQVQSHWATSDVCAVTQLLVEPVSMLASTLHEGRLVRY